MLGRILPKAARSPSERKKEKERKGKEKKEEEEEKNSVGTKRRHKGGEIQGHVAPCRPVSVYTCTLGEKNWCPRRFQYREGGILWFPPSGQPRTG